MNTLELLNSKISLYRRVSETISCAEITLDEWLHRVCFMGIDTIDDIRRVNKTDCKSAKAMKVMNLPCCTISGIFRGERKADQVSEKNPIICIDIDDKPSDYTWEELKKKMIALPYVFYAGLSVRGNGIFVLVYYNMENDFLGTFQSLQREFSDMGILIDPSCKDICRLRFASYDDNALEKDGEVEMYDKVLVKTETKEVTVNCSAHNPEEIDDYFTYKVIYYLINKCNYRVNDYNDWMTDGMRLATFGKNGYALFMYLSQVSPGWDEYAAKRQWERCSKYTRMNKDSLLHYYREAKERLGPDWKEIIERG